MSNLQKKVIGYVRVSTEEQKKKGLSIDHQKEKIKLYAALNDLKLVDTIVDAGVSAKNLNGRPGIKRIIQLARKKEIDGVVVYKLDRLFRSSKDAHNTCHMFKKQGVAFHSVTEQIDTESPLGQFFFSIMSACAELERNLVSQRTSDVLKSRREAGKVYNHAPYGFNKDGEDLKLNKEEMKVVQRIYNLHLSGESYAAIAIILNDEKIPTKKDKEWHRSTVSNVINNEETIYKKYLE
ncbi:MAG: recombinase family protein, partial [Candidatus Peribacteraceae bacterium]|nr:recombinase family protein [Candidatus Peribacteraceae bacterium]